MEKLSVKDAMERLNVAETTIRRMIQRGDLPNTARVDRKIWIPLSDIEAYEQRQMTSASQISAEPAAPSPLNAPASPRRRESAANVQSVLKERPETEEAEIVFESQPGNLASQSTPIPKVQTTSAHPISAQAVSPESSSEPVPYPSGAVQSRREHEQSFKWLAVQAGILSTTWLEEIFHSIRVALEKYKRKSFPQSPEK